MEELLNKLIKRGWKPYGISRVKNVVALNHCICFSKRTIFGIEFFEYTLRSLVSKESGLWQFCCENKMVKEDDGHITRIISEYKDNKGIIDVGFDYHYWLMICSILDESELEEFLIDNIKVGNEQL